MIFKRPFLAAVVVITATMGSSLRASIVYDAAVDFSKTTNPNGVWTYGQYTGLDPATFSHFQYVVEGTNPFQDIYQWSNVAAPNDPNIDYNTGSVTGGSGVQFDPNKLTLGPYGGPTVVRFTAPTAGRYDIVATFTTVQTVNAPPTAYVFLGGVATASYQLSDPPDGQQQIGSPWIYKSGLEFLKLSRR